MRWILMGLCLNLAALATENPYSLQVNGFAIQSIQTTLANVRIGIEIEGKTSEEIEKILSEKNNQVTTLIKKENPKQLQSKHFSIYPEYSNQSPPEIVSYRGQSEIQFQLPIDKATGLIPQLVKIDGVKVNGIELKATDEATADARAKALQDASINAMKEAKIVLDALQLNFREIESINILPSRNTPIPYGSNFKTMAISQDSPGPNLEGKQEVQAEVSIQIRFKS